MTTNSNAISITPTSPFAVFKRRNFTLMWVGQLISTMGSSLTSLAASILVYRITGSAASVGLMLMATAAPSVIVGLFAGVFVDRYDRKIIMIIADIIRAILVFMIPFLVPINIVWLYIVVAVSSAVGQFYDPAHESILPEVAPDEELAAANALMAISSFGSTAIGFAASGLIASRMDIKWAFYLDAFSFLVSAICILFLRIKPIEKTEATSVSIVLENLRSGLRFLFNTPHLRSLFIISIPILIGFGLSNSLLLPFSTRALNATEFEYGLQEGLTSLGFVAGSLMMASIAGRLFEGQWLTISFVGMGLAGIAYSFSTRVPIAILILIISGFMNAPSAISRRLIIQRHAPREMRGRVNSAFFVSRDILFLIGMACAGFADLIDVRVMYFLSSVAILGGGILVQFLPGLRHEAAEWRRSWTLLRTAPGAPGLGIGRVALPVDMDLLAGLIPQMSVLGQKDREALLRQARVYEAPSGTRIVRHGEAGDSAFFILSGQVLVGLTTEEGNYRSLATLQTGDFFGEIAALTGAKRTANVVADGTTTLLQVSAEALRGLMRHPELSQLFLSKMTERLMTTNVSDLPRLAGYDQQDLRDLRTSQPVQIQPSLEAA
jgi:CRP-like cAMP-binding protein/predicted MFS family arabinose efflux permease